MPAKSAKQYGAMQAAARGKGRKGIPRKVAQEFIEETPPATRKRFAQQLAKKRARVRQHRR